VGEAILVWVPARGRLDHGVTSKVLASIPQSGTRQADSQTLPLLELEADPRMGSEPLT
jgi:hypothetical protein